MLPKSVNIKGHKYKLYYKKINPDLMGACDKEKKHIYLNATHIKNAKEALDTLTHELCHAHIKEYNLDTVLSYEVEELICMMSEDIAKKLVPFIIANKKDFSG